MAVKTKADYSGDEDAPEGREFPSPVDMFPEPADLAMLQERIKSDLLAFPEAAVLDGRQLDDAVGRVIRESNPSPATPTARGMVRFGDYDISQAFIHINWLGLPTNEDLPPTGVIPLGWLDERRRELDEDVQPEKRYEPDSLRFLLAKIRVDLLTRGYVELLELYLDFTVPVRIQSSPAVMDG